MTDETAESDLSLVPTAELIAELKSRFDVLLIAGYQRTIPANFEMRTWNHPDMLSTTMLARMTWLSQLATLDRQSLMGGGAQPGGSTP